MTTRRRSEIGHTYPVPTILPYNQAESTQRSGGIVITNVPGAEELRDVALRLYFSAWSSIMGLTIRFEETFGAAFENDPNDSDNWAEEREGYLKQAQPDLQSTCAIIQQSNELALKARICEVSPFLLLIGSDHRFGASAKDVDFADFRTIDAVELPRAVNSICAATLSDQFVQSYNYIRSRRNRIAHLGSVKEMLQPRELRDILVSQYVDLWPERHWLQDRLACESVGASAFFHDGRYFSAHLEVLHEWPYTIQILGNSQFKKLFGHSKSQRRYLCHVCVEAAPTKYADMNDSQYATAFLREDESHLDCAMCGDAFKVVRTPCQQTGCKGNYLADNGDEHDGTCHTCGQAMQ